MSVPRDPSTTEIHEPPQKFFRGQYPGRAQIDLDDMSVVANLSARMARGTPRRLMMASLEELRAITELLGWTWPVFEAAVTLAYESDRNASPAEVKRALEALITRARPFVGPQP